MVRKKSFKYTPILVIIAVVVIIALYQSGFLASFITTCTNIEPDTTQEFQSLFEDVFGTVSTATPNPIIYKEELLDENNTVIDIIEHTLVGVTYKDDYSYDVYDTNPFGCKEVISYLLEEEVNRLTDLFIPEIIRPNYEETEQYYVFDGTNYDELNTMPVVGQEYYKKAGDDYVLMPVPYMTSPPTIKSDPLYFYTPIGYKTISGKLINGVLYWCSNNKVTLLSVGDDYVDSINNYGEKVIVCETVWVNDTKKDMETCLEDFGIWEELGFCACPEGEDYVKGMPCLVEEEVVSTGTSGGRVITPIEEGVVETISTKERKGLSTNTIIGIILIVGIVAYLLYKNFFKKRRGKKRKIF